MSPLFCLFSDNFPRHNDVNRNYDQQYFRCFLWRGHKKGITVIRMLEKFTRSSWETSRILFRVREREDAHDENLEATWGALSEIQAFFCMWCVKGAKVLLQHVLHTKWRAHASHQEPNKLPKNAGWENRFFFVGRICRRALRKLHLLVSGCRKTAFAAHTVARLIEGGKG